MAHIATPALFGSATTARRGYFARVVDRMMEGRDREARRFAYGHALTMDDSLIPAYGYGRRQADTRAAARMPVV